GYSLFTTGGTNASYYNYFIQDDLNSANNENILSRTYIRDLLMQNTSRAVGQSNNGFSKNFAQQYLCTDGRPISQSTLYQGDNTPDDEATNRDPRYRQTIATRGFVFLVNPNGTQDVITLPRIGSAVTSTGYQMAKYRSADNAQNQQAQSTIDIPVFRYAEVLLNYAEAKAELNEATQAVISASINLLRARVGMPNMVVGTLVKDANSDFPTIPVLIDEIRRERRIELVLEGFRFDDLLRWRAGTQFQKPETILGMKLTPALRAQYPANQVANVQVNGDNYIRLYPANRVWNDRQYYYPLPTQEILLNPRLTQNPGW
ncbi:MAG: RagB/SusD family nutrient uptake outer membrane protein, partial [Sphingobacteriaceae bacterium]